MNQNSTLRKTFDTEALIYNSIRPRYPERLFDTLVQVTKLPARARLLEIGPGTGQATVSLASRQYEILAVELGENLAAVARQALRGFPNVTIVTGAFEQVELPAAAFDLVYAATSFHWIDPSAQFRKPHVLLKEGGHLAVIRSEHVSDEIGDEFFFASQPIYDRYWPRNDTGQFRLPQAKALRPFEVDTTLFAPVLYEDFPVAIRYSAEEYSMLLSSFSPTLALPETARASFLSEISKLIADQFEGHVTKQYAMTLSVARRI